MAPVAEKDPSDLGVAYVFGTALMRAGKCTKARSNSTKSCVRAIRGGRLLMGTAKVAASDFAGALIDFQKAVEMNPKVPTLQAAYGQALMATGDTAGAAKPLPPNSRKIQRLPSNLISPCFASRINNTLTP